MLIFINNIYNKDYDKNFDTYFGVSNRIKESNKEMSNMLELQEPMLQTTDQNVYIYIRINIYYIIY